MRLFVSFLIFTFSVFLTFSTYATNYPTTRIKRYATNTPRKVENNLNTLVKHLVKPLDDDYDKAKMIAFWIASHINYDAYLYNEWHTTSLIKSHKTQSADKLLKSRAGICSEFALLFEKMCNIADISAGVIEGYAYPSKYHISKKQRKNFAHAWNYFYYKGKKVYVDTTFMAKGNVKPSSYIRNYAHKRALRKIEHENKYESQVNEFDEYYFDFSYKNEKNERKYTRKEK